MEENSTSTAKRIATPETRKLISEGLKRLWADPEIRRKRLEANVRGHANPKVRTRMRLATKSSWKDPKVRKARTDGTRQALADPRVRQRMGEASKRGWADPEVRRRRIEGIQRALSDPKSRKRRSNISKRALSNADVRQRISNASKQSWAARNAILKAAKHALDQRMPEERPVGRPPNLELGRRVRELRARHTSWGRLKVILDRETGEPRALSTYRWYAGNS